jgi:hypothetical protein
MPFGNRGDAGEPSGVGIRSTRFLPGRSSAEVPIVEPSWIEPCQGSASAGPLLFTQMSIAVGPSSLFSHRSPTCHIRQAVRLGATMAT